MTATEVGPNRRTRLRRRISAGMALFLALGAVGVLYSLAAPSSSAADTAVPADVQAGQTLFEKGCITCHGRNLQGVADRGPSLIGVGAAAVYFQVSTGRMPVQAEEAQAPRKTPLYDDDEVLQLAAFIEANGGGPTLPTGNLRDGNLADGGELFRLNCASCHNFVGRGGALSSGKYAPSLSEANDLTIYTAMLSGPQNMPVFGDNQLTPENKRSIINYIQTLKDTSDPGGAGIGRAGPVPEGIVIWVAGIAACLVACVWIGSKS